MYICIYMYIHIYICMYIYIYTCIYNIPAVVQFLSFLTTPAGSQKDQDYSYRLQVKGFYATWLKKNWGTRYLFLQNLRNEKDLSRSDSSPLLEYPSEHRFPCIFCFRKCVRLRECICACMYTHFIVSVYECVCVNVRVYVRVCVRVHAPQPALGCLKILEACSEHLFVSLEDYFPIRVVCSTITLDSH